MSRLATTFRPFTRLGWGGRASSSFRGLLSEAAGVRGQIGTVIYRNPGVYQNYAVSGVTRDSAGAILPFCRVELYLTAMDVSIREATSDASGNFRFESPGTGPFYMVAYKAGSPDVAGTTVNTLVSA